MLLCDYYGIQLEKPIYVVIVVGRSKLTIPATVDGHLTHTQHELREAVRRSGPSATADTSSSSTRQFAR